MNWQRTNRDLYIAHENDVCFSIKRAYFHGVATGGWTLLEGEEHVDHFDTIKAAKAAAHVGIAAKMTARREAESKRFWAHEAEAWDYKPGEVLAHILSDEPSQSGTLIAGGEFVPAGEDVEAAQLRARVAAAEAKVDRIDLDLEECKANANEPDGFAACEELAADLLIARVELDRLGAAQAYHAVRVKMDALVAKGHMSEADLTEYSRMSYVAGTLLAQSKKDPAKGFLSALGCKNVAEYEALLAKCARKERDETGERMARMPYETTLGNAYGGPNKHESTASVERALYDDDLTDEDISPQPR